MMGQSLLETTFLLLHFLCVVSPSCFWGRKVFSKQTLPRVNFSRVHVLPCSGCLGAVVGPASQVLSLHCSLFLWLSLQFEARLLSSSLDDGQRLLETISRFSCFLCIITPVSYWAGRGCFLRKVRARIGTQFPFFAFCFCWEVALVRDHEVKLL